MNSRTVAVTLVAVAAMSLLLAACGSSSKENSSSGSSENTFGLSEFTIIPPSNTLRAGSVDITADNLGAEPHELVIVRADSVDSLPKKADGSVDEDKIPEADKVGEIDNVASKTQITKTFDLTAGKYVALCNLVDSMTGSSSSMMHGDSEMSEGSGMGHVHFAEGMHLPFTVS
jgi:hypothetical protein